MRRRNFIFGLMAAATVGNARAEQKAQRIAFAFPSIPVSIMTETSGDPLFKGLFNELRHLGYVEGQNLLIERYSGEGRAVHFPDLAQNVVRRNPELIVVIGSNNLVLDFKAATTTIPIVGAMAAPVESGIVASLARPGGNITGVAVDVGREQWGKRVQLLQQVVPQATRFGYLQTRAAREHWLPRLLYPGVNWVGPALDRPTNETEYNRVFAALAQDGAEGIVVSDEEDNVANLKSIIELAEKNRLPTIYPFAFFVEAGGLMSYGMNIPAFGRSVADVVGQVLKGAKPADIPILQPTKFELGINLKTAKALGLTVPPELLATADEVIE
jgi:putative ABC transport system substrate-binding protein